MSKEMRKPGRENKKAKQTGAKTKKSDYQERQTTSAAAQTPFKMKKK